MVVAAGSTRQGTMDRSASFIDGDMKGRPSRCAFRQTKNVFKASKMASAQSQSEAKPRGEIWRSTPGAFSAQRCSRSQMNAAKVTETTQPARGSEAEIA